MKPLKPILIVISVGLLFGLGCRRSENETRALFEKVGGIEKVNKEAKTIFAIFPTNEVSTLQAYGHSSLSYYPEVMTNHPEVKDFPAVFALGKFVILMGGPSNQTAWIEVKFGSHRNGGHYLIFPPGFNIGADTNWASCLSDPNYFLLASNIIASK